MKDMDYENISQKISNITYRTNIKAVEELVELFNNILKVKPETWEDIVRIYDDSFYTYKTFEELVQSEIEQSNGFTLEECKEQIGKSIWQLPCGWYVQAI